MAGRFLTDTTLDNVSRGLTVVEVLGVLKGSGILVQMDDQAVVITNSHNLQGSSHARIKLPKRTVRLVELEPLGTNRYEVGFETNAQVIYDDPYTDFAILQFKLESLKTQEVVGMYAALNGRFNLRGDGPRGWIPGRERGRRDENTIAAVLDGKNMGTEVVEGINSVFKKESISIPAYSRPGVSGGAYYHNGLLQGLVVRVSLVAEPLTEAIPLKLIGEILVGRPAARARWSQGALIYRDGTDEISVKAGTNGGGETGHGGGETGHGGGETGHGGGETGHGGDGASQYLKLEVLDAFGHHEVTTWNPFNLRKSSFEINGQRIAYFEINGKAQLPGLDKYLQHKRGLKTFRSTEENLTRLLQLRQVRQRAIKYARFYTYDRTKNFYELESFHPSVYATYGVQKLVPGRYEPPFSLKVPGNELFEVLFTSKELIIRGDLAFSEVQVGNKRLELVDQTVSTMLFSDGGKTKVAYTFDADDLSKIERIYLLYGDHIMEFWP